MPVGVHEFLIAPLALALAFLHARRALGSSVALLELGALALYGYALERCAMSLFASHDYLGVWRCAPLGVPLAVAGVWAALILCSLTLSARLGLRTPLQRAAGAALIGIGLDLLMEPVAVRAGLWRWTPPGPWLYVPLGNFVGWGVIVGVYSWGAEHAWPAQRLGRRLVYRGLLATGSIAVLLGVGVLWTRLGCEGLFASGRGALLAGCLWCATAGLPRLARRLAESPPPSSLATHLAGARGRLPEWVLGLLLLTFVSDALALRQAQLALPVVGALAALGSVLAASFAGARSRDVSGTVS